MSQFEDSPFGGQEPEKASDTRAEAELGFRRDSARMLIQVNDQLGRPSSDELQQFAAGETDEYDTRTEEEKLLSPDELLVRNSAQLQIEVQERLGRPVSDELRRLA